MFTIKNALLYVKNHNGDTSEAISQFLSQQTGVSRIAPSGRSNGLIFIDYQPGAVSMTEISHNLEREGMIARIVGM